MNTMKIKSGMIRGAVPLGAWYRFEILNTRGSLSRHGLGYSYFEKTPTEDELDDHCNMLAHEMGGHRDGLLVLCSSPFEGAAPEGYRGQENRSPERYCCLER